MMSFYLVELAGHHLPGSQALPEARLEEAVNDKSNNALALWDHQSITSIIWCVLSLLVNHDCF